MSALLAPATPRRIKATHRRRRKIASGRFVQRYYDPEIGRFISPDPVGPEEDFVNHFNRYNYAQNNPVRYTDPDGQRYTCAPTCTLEQMDAEYNEWKHNDAREFLSVVMIGPTVATGGYYLRAFGSAGAAYYKNNSTKVNESIYKACVAISFCTAFNKDGIAKPDRDLPERSRDEIAQASTKSIPAKPIAGASGKSPNSTTISINGATIKVTVDQKTGVATVTTSKTGTRIIEVKRFEPKK